MLLVVYTNASTLSKKELIFLSHKFIVCSHEEIDVSHPEFFSAAKQNGYVPPNKEVLSIYS